MVENKHLVPHLNADFASLGPISYMMINTHPEVSRAVDADAAFGIVLKPSSSRRSI